jgi:serine protease AprX
MLGDPMPTRVTIWQISLNRRASPALERSVPAVKGDAARTLFNVRCDRIGWAVLDSGVDRDHPAFLDENGEQSRVQAVFDFSRIREIMSLARSSEVAPDAPRRGRRGAASD